jgi:DNA-binding transcriptional MocR family regulator
MKKSITRYERLAEEISSQIRAGVLQAGDRVPSVRAFSRSRGFSSNTVLQAYHFLEDRGEIRARSRSGYFVSAEAATRANQATGALRTRPVRARSTEDLVYEVFETARLRSHVHFGNAWPSAQLFPMKRLARAFHASARKLSLDAMPPYYPRENTELRRHIARRSLEWGFSGNLQEVVITAGALEALNLCLRAVAKPGDLVAIESATLYGVRSAVERFGLRAIEIPTHLRDGVSLPALVSALKKNPVRACVFMPTFHHPLGSLMPEEKKRELVRLLASRDIPLIENDVMGELYYGQSRPKPAKAFDRKGLVLYCSSFSKCLAPGYGVGWALPGKFTRTVQRAKWTSNTVSGLPNQEAITQFLQHGGYEHHLRRLRRSLAALQRLTVQAVTRSFPSGTSISRPAGGYLAWIQLPKKVSSVAAYRVALENKITIAPGPIFSARADYENCFRLNYGQEWSPRVEEAIATLGRIVASLA